LGTFISFDVVKAMKWLVISATCALAWGTLMVIGFLGVLLGYDMFCHSSKRNRWARYE
jgi:hypothetical protein